MATWDLEFFFHSDTLQSSINFFRNEQKDLINRVPVAPQVVSFLNQGELTIEGVELETKSAFNTFPSVDTGRAVVGSVTFAF